VSNVTKVNFKKIQEKMTAMIAMQEGIKMSKVFHTVCHACLDATNQLLGKKSALTACPIYIHLCQHKSFVCPAGKGNQQQARKEAARARHVHQVKQVRRAQHAYQVRTVTVKRRV
jgi:hypothetical protein